jgi:ppGpp synthetase/RelA/SpoT-type nucleotidyltranferase
MNIDKFLPEILVRYSREHDRYLKLATRVADICREEIVGANAIRAQVTFRTKSETSLVGKLRRLASKQELPPMVEPLFNLVGDLAAVRISTYEERSQKKVEQEIQKRFMAPDGGTINPEQKNKQAADKSNFYCATHFQACLRPDDLVGTYRNLVGAPCEIQVCTMMAHVWNEIEHDLGYKPLSGDLSKREKDLLITLGQLTRTGDGVISQLLDATNARQEELEGQFEDVYDFVARMRKWFLKDFANYAGQLFEEIRTLGITTPKEIESLIGGKAGAAERASRALADFNAELKRRLELRYTLEDDSSDLLLVLLLPTQAKRITENHPTGRGIGGPPRIAWIAARFRPDATESVDAPLA